jgi:hypothetical protein
VEVIQKIPREHGHTAVCICKCGNKWIGKLSVAKRIKTCGRCNNPKVGDRFGKLVVVEIITKNSFGCSVVCNCDCGRQWKGFLRDLRRKKVLNCSNCGFYMNGVAISSSAIKLHGLFGMGELNYNIEEIRYKNNRPMNVDIALPCEKIAIEYNEWYWHRKSLNKDRRKILRLLQGGWKILIINARNNLPTREEIVWGISMMRNSYTPIFTLTLDGWGEN